jgi:hypothetical protein
MVVTNSQEIGNPESVKEITSTDFLLTVILAEIEESHQIGVPRLKVDSERSGTFVTALVDISGSRIVRAEHGDNTIRDTVGTSNIGASKKA